MTKQTDKQFDNFQKKDQNHFKVVIFGSSRIKKNDSVYKKVEHLAMMLGEAGIDVVTGGGPGLMEAANAGHERGAKNTKVRSHSIGIGVKLLWRQRFNNAVEYKKEFNNFSQRLDEFMLLSDAIVVAPGGLGTMLELFYAWQLVQVHHICDVPIILLGDKWDGLLNWIKQNPLHKKYLDETDYEIVYHVQTAKQAAKIIEERYNHVKAGGKNFCLNYKKYKIK
ncbi:MAG: LOG family protein [Candidatus Pacebacteria bacterium]|nr:LOG family protein [Candidatus Paceibacterota bacterium]